VASNRDRDAWATGWLIAMPKFQIAHHPLGIAKRPDLKHAQIREQIVENRRARNRDLIHADLRLD
jgi:hypothetical protein